jgi:hypothetical protein
MGFAIFVLPACATSSAVMEHVNLGAAIGSDSEMRDVTHFGGFLWRDVLGNIVIVDEKGNDPATESQKDETQAGCKNRKLS